MADRLSIHPSVPHDLAGALRWYEELSADLGNRFRDAFDAQLDEVGRRSASFPVAYDDVRFARIPRFPYIVLFREIGEIIRILGLFHAASDPAKWRQRSSDS